MKNKIDNEMESNGHDRYILYRGSMGLFRGITPIMANQTKKIRNMTSMLCSYSRL